MEKRYCTAIVLAAGKGRRMGGETAKQYMEIGGKPLVAYALEAFEASPVIDEIILMTDADHIEYCRAKIVETYGLKKVSTIGAGGSERYKSVWKALCTLMEYGDETCDCISKPGQVFAGSSMAGARQDGYVFIHDGARPFINGEIIERAYEAVCRYGACVAGMPVKDTIKLVNREGMIESSPDRCLVWQAQTPQVFSVPLIVEAFTRQMKEDCSGITDDAMVLEAQMGVKAHMVKGSYANIKITTQEDLYMAEALRNSMAEL